MRKAALFQMKLFCLPPYRKTQKQNPIYITVNVWPTMAEARGYFKSLDEKWGRTAIAYFMEYQDPARKNLLGDAHFTLRNFSIATVSHEFAHAAESFADRHALAEVVHCPYEMGNNREECVAYVLGTLMDSFYKQLPPAMLKRWFGNSQKPVQ